MSTTPRFSERTLLEAVDLFAYALAGTNIDRLIQRLLPEDSPERRRALRNNQGKQANVNEITQFAQKNPNHQTALGSNLRDEIVKEAAFLPIQQRSPAFVHALARDGFTLEDDGTLRRALPCIADLPRADDEIHTLLDELNMETAKGHLDQAIANHSQGKWAAANGQLRTFLEELFNEIARRLAPTRAAKMSSSENMKQLLAMTDPPFLQESLGEWSQDGKNFINGVFKRLHGEGSHPGLSGDDDSTFRLHLVLILARHYLRRAQSFCERHQSTHISHIDRTWRAVISNGTTWCSRIA